MILRLIWHWAILVLGLYLVTLITPLGISFDKPSDLAWAALVLILVNTFIKPILILISLPLVLLSLGLFLLVINAIILYMLPDFVHGFHVPSFLAAFIGSLVLSLITGCFTGYEKRVKRSNVSTGSGRVIDI
ncbi:MAG: phage holin family protein [Methylacidiphilales bacterium]|nr:phage holin family protein [Candidatus Methylacidiphilales bacterium]